MALDPEFIKKVQERKARREALENKYGTQDAPAPRQRKSSGSSQPRKNEPVYRSVSMANGKETIIRGPEADRLTDKLKYKPGG